MNKKLRLAIEKFNNNEFFDCHEILEELWFESKSVNRKKLYQGILHYAVAFHHLIHKKNFKGAQLQFKKCIECLKDFEGNQQGIDIYSIKLSAESYLKKLNFETIRHIKVPKIKSD